MSKYYKVIPNNIVYSGTKQNKKIIGELIKLCKNKYNINVSKYKNYMNELLILPKNEIILKNLCYFIELLEISKIIDKGIGEFDKFYDEPIKMIYDFGDFEERFLGLRRTYLVRDSDFAISNNLEYINILRENILDQFGLNHTELNFCILFIKQQSDRYFNKFYQLILKGEGEQIDGIFGDICKRYYNVCKIIGKGNNFKKFCRFHRSLFKVLPNISRISYFTLCSDILTIYKRYTSLILMCAGMDSEVFEKGEFNIGNKKGSILTNHRINYNLIQKGYELKVKKTNQTCDLLYTNFEELTDSRVTGKSTELYYDNWIQWCGLVLNKKDKLQPFSKMNKRVNRKIYRLNSDIDNFQLGAIIATFNEKINKVRNMSDLKAEQNEPLWILKAAQKKDLIYFENNYNDLTFRKNYPYIFPDEMKTIALLGRLIHGTGYEKFVFNLYKKLQCTRVEYRNLIKK